MSRYHTFEVVSRLLDLKPQICENDLDYSNLSDNFLTLKETY